MVTSGAALLTTFQLASTALTIIPLLMLLPTVCAAGVPVLPGVGPVVVPGAAVSPGNRICSLVTEPGLTVRLELAIPAVVPSVAVTVVGSALVNVVANVVVDWPLVKLTAVV